jgi:arabinan endo-1,5-alpha-L-arabinosidase
MSNFFKWLAIPGMMALMMNLSCQKDDIGIPDGKEEEEEDTIVVVPVDTAYLAAFKDEYWTLYTYDNVYEWGPYNVHDPSILNDSDYFYCYSTDVFYGLPILRAGIQVRRSEDLVHWEFIGWAYDGRPSQAVEYITSNGGSPVDNVWAPYIMKAGDEYRLYYSQASNIGKLSAIGLTTSDSPEGPWTEKGLVVTSHPNFFMPNGIDPSVVVDQDGGHWMFYGSSWDGIYILELDPVTGLAKNSGSKGKRIAHRGFTNNVMNGNIEAPEIIYNPAFNRYYLFISYDWLSTKYNVRVGRADKVDGPYCDYNGTDLNTNVDNIPMIQAPYAFSAHSGWQGIAHCTVFEDDSQFYIASQARPRTNPNFMDLHVRRILWTEDGWPVVSPERYAGITRTPVNPEEMEGEWEYIEFKYTVVPGFAEEQTDPQIQKAVGITLASGGTINDDPGNTWNFNNQLLEMNWNNVTIDRVMVERGWDWERKNETILFTGLNNKGTTVWGKKKL